MTARAITRLAAACRHILAGVYTAAGVFVLALGVFGLAHHWLTPREALIGTGGLVVAAVSWLWLRRGQRPVDDGWAPMDRSECPYGCDHGDREEAP